MVTVENDMAISNRIVQEIICGAFMIFRFQDNLCAAQIFFILVAKDLRLAAEWAGQVTWKLENGAFEKNVVESEKRLLCERLATEKSDKRAYAKNRCEEIMFADEVYKKYRPTKGGSTPEEEPETPETPEEPEEIL